MRDNHEYMNIEHDQFSWTFDKDGISVSYCCPDDYYNSWDEVSWKEIIESAAHPKIEICTDSRILYEFAKRGQIRGDEFEHVANELNMCRSTFYYAFNRLAWEQGLMDSKPDTESKADLYFIKEQYAAMLPLLVQTVDK